MILMFEKGIRGGICQATNRYAKANNKYMNNYDVDKKSSYIQYLDANNLYGYAMSKKIPVGNFKWLGKDEISKFNDKFIKKYDENSDIGYIFEVEVEYPKYIRMLHSDLPFLPERIKINNCTKLVCTVKDKKKLCSTYSSFKASIRLWIKINKMT